MTYDRSGLEAEAIAEFLSEYFPEQCGDSGQLVGESREAIESELSREELEAIEAIVGTVESEFESSNPSKGILGLALDFLMVAEELSRVDDRLDGFQPSIDRDDLFTWYDNEAKTSLTLGDDTGSYSIRSVHNDVIDLFREDLRRTNFPSSPGHHTGEWDRYVEMLEMSFQLTSDGRFEAAQQLFDFGLEYFAARSFETREPPFPDPLKCAWEDYERSHPNEEGGLTYQALSYGYVRTKWPHLSFRASKVRTGSSRQHRYGDIDGYYGPDLMVSVEVKDLPIDESNVNSELGSMMELAERTNVVVVAMCREASDEAVAKLESTGIEVLTDNDLVAAFDLWDYHKQNRAVQGTVHFLGNVEEDPAAVQRFLGFIESVDPNNPALVHLEAETGKID